MRAKNTNKMRQFSSLLNEHWKRKQRLKGAAIERSSRIQKQQGVEKEADRRTQTPRPIVQNCLRQQFLVGTPRAVDRTKSKKTRKQEQGAKTSMIDTFRAQTFSSASKMKATAAATEHLLPSFACTSSLKAAKATASVTATILLSWAFLLAGGQNPIQQDPRPTIYSGQVSFGLLLSAHSTLGSELSAAASNQVHHTTAASPEPGDSASKPAVDERSAAAPTTRALADDLLTASNNSLMFSSNSSKQLQQHLDSKHVADLQFSSSSLSSAMLETAAAFEPRPQLVSLSLANSINGAYGNAQHGRRAHDKRQIFERKTNSSGQHARQQQQTGGRSSSTAAAASAGQGGDFATRAGSLTATCGQANPNALYAGMGAIWASHQANLVGDSPLAIGTYVYDSCNDLDVGQRQSVRIVSNLNAFQQTTCESPRGSPISLTIAHGDNQLRAIQLLSSFRVPVITTKEHFALEDYNQLTREQKRYLFTTAPSSRHLATGALRFSKRIVARSASSAKLANQFYKMSPKNALIMISRNLPARFITYLTEMIPSHVNYEMLQSSQPIDQVRSIEALESILVKNSRTPMSPDNSNMAAAVSSMNWATTQPTISAEKQPDRRSGGRAKRNLDYFEDTDSLSSPSAQAGAGGEFESGAELDSQTTKMLSPTILMFITPSEAIDLVTRLRNDLAEVSRYYSLIVVTREDISLALKTIFRRGGSRLCSGKAFYTISPKPDDIGEFSRYFRDTVQMEGDTSDHPLICEFARYQATSKVGADLDDISTEPVIKAVWSAAAAFKSVHKRECASLAPSPSSSSSPSSASLPAMASNLFSSRPGSESPSGIEGRITNARQQAAASASSRSAHAECMVKINKNMSNLVQRALKRLDVIINSTGLQALDGFRVKFDDLNELMTNKFSIRYINKECEITELGQYSGLKDSALSIDEETLIKSLESTVPEPWPVSQQAAQFGSTPTSAAQPSSLPPSLATSPTATLSSSFVPSSPGDSSGAATGDFSDGNSSGGAGDSDRSTTPGPRDSSSSAANDGEPGDEDGTSGGDEKAESEDSDRRRQRKRSKQEAADGRLAKRKIDSELVGSKRQHHKLPVTALGGRAIMRGLTGHMESTSGTGDHPHSSTSKTPTVTTDAPTSTVSRAPSPIQTMEPSTRLPLRPMRKLKPFPTTTGTTLVSDWLPSETLGGVGGGPSPAPLQPTGTVTAAAAAVTTTRATGEQLVDGPSQSILSSVVAGSIKSNRQVRDDELIDSGGGRSSTNDDLKMRGTTQAPTIVYSTLPESGGNADLELPISRTTTVAETATNSARNNTDSIAASTSHVGPTAATNLKGKLLDTEASTDFVTAASVSSSPTAATTDQVDSTAHQHSPLGRLGLLLGLQGSASSGGLSSSTVAPQRGDHSLEETGSSSSLNYLKDLESTQVRLSPSTPAFTAGFDGGTATQQQRSAFRGPQLENSASADRQLASDLKHTVGARSRLRSHLKWIYSSWFALAILAANVCGALMTLYVLTFLLMKNCDGSLDRERQGIRSMHLLAIIMVFFGSTLFIVYPTPGLCLLRSSWQNFALVMLFGSLLLQSMQTRSLSSLGLGGRPNRLNQFLTLMFMVGVQLAYELQRLKYESVNYLSFVNQYFGSASDGSDDNKKLLTLSSAIANQFNPLNSFNDQVTPVSIQVSEQYQNLLQDHCIQHPDEFLHSQIYLFIIVGLLIIFSASNRKIRGHSAATTSAHHKLASALTSGKLVASQHEANLNLSPSHLHHRNQNQYSSTSGGGGGGIISRERDNVFMVTLISVPIYSIAVVLHIYGQNPANRDLISSVTLVLIAFVALACLFLPILLQIYRLDGIRAASNLDHLPGSLSRAPMMTQSKLPEMSPSTMSASGGGAGSGHAGSINAAFTMFPEFAPNGLRRPSSVSGDSSSGGGSRRPFAETKESRRKMGVSLANLGPSEDSLISMGFYSSQRSDDKPIDPALLNLKLNLSANDELTTPIADEMYQAEPSQQNHRHQQYHHRPQMPARRSKQSEKRLVMLDVDPCCPRHGLAAWPTAAATGSSHRRAINNGGGESPASPCTSRGAKPRTPHAHQ